jgi:LCP family protein required for cell wall assembly
MEKKKPVVPVIILFLIFIVLGCIAYMNSLLNRIDRTAEPVTRSELGFSEEAGKKLYKYSEKVLIIALFGIDCEKGDKGRSDTIMILSIDKSQNKLKLTSIMRDSFVTISGHGKDKINHAYAFGGPQLAIKTLNENFKLNITKYVAVNFAELTTVIDKLGGVEITISDAEAAEIPGLEHGGTYNLTGAQALAYSRIRHLDGGDYERTHRQRILMEKLYSLLISRRVSQYGAIAGELLSAMKTNLPDSEIITLSTYLAISRPQLEDARFPTDDTSSGQNINGIYYLVFQEKETVEAMHKFIFGDSL